MKVFLENHTQRLNRRKIIILISAITLTITYYGLLVASIWQYTMDDSYISFRYARNLFDGFGLRFNPDDAEPAEGFTSILWIVFLLPAHLLGLSLDLYAKLISLTFITLTTISIYISLSFIFRKNNDELLGTVTPITGASLYLCFFPVSILTVSGMETALSSLLVSIAALQFLHFEKRARPVDVAIFSLTLLCLGLARPELNIIALILSASSILMAKDSKERILLAVGFASYALIGFAYFCWRWWYFSSLLPLPFYIKAGDPGLLGVASVMAFLKEPLVALIFILGLFSQGRYRIILMAAIAHILFFMKPLHLMGTGFRFLMPIMPILIIAGLSSAQRFLSGPIPRIRVMVSAILLIAVSTASFNKNEISHLNMYAESLKSTYGSIGAELKSQVHDGTVAISSVGLISYESNWHVIDIFGLCNKKIAKNPENRIKTIFEAKPKYVILSSSSKEIYLPIKSAHKSDFNQTIFQQAISRGYQVDRVLEFLQGYYLFVLKLTPDDIETVDRSSRMHTSLGSL